MEIHRRNFATRHALCIFYAAISVSFVLFFVYKKYFSVTLSKCGKYTAIIK